MNKKGDLLKNASSTIIAVIAIVIIFIGGGKLYANYVNQEETNAQKAIDSLIGKIDAFAEDNVPRSFPFRGFESSKDNGWSLIGWSKNEAERPDKCYFKSCICICPDIKLGDKNTYIETCQTGGFCRLLEQDYVYLYRVSYRTLEDQKNRVPAEVIELSVDLSKVDEGQGLHYTDLTKQFDLISNNRIRIPSNFIELEIRKDVSKLSVVYPKYSP